MASEAERPAVLVLPAAVPTLNIYYMEPRPDRWVRWDRVPRALLRRIVRGPENVGGQRRVFLNLCAGLRGLGVSLRINDFRRARTHPNEVICIVGKSHVLDCHQWRNPILFGAATFSHPIEKPDFFARYPKVRLILVPGEWMRRMWEPYYGDRVKAWPVGIDTENWRSTTTDAKTVDFLLYDKVRWLHQDFEASLIEPIRTELIRRNLTFREIRYGFYREDQFHSALKQCRAMIFLCEHETQGIAYQQALSMNVPILAWDRGGYWQDPAFYPRRVQYEPVSSVPYWDHRCGTKFRDRAEFPEKLDEFMRQIAQNAFWPREYIIENLTLQKCAARYLEIYQEVENKA